MSGFTRVGLSAVTALTMAVATFPQVIYGVLAAYLITEFEADRWQVGALVTATGLVGALVAPPLGRVTDRVGALRATRSILGLGIVSLTLIAAAPSYLLLVAAALLSGAMQGWANPATNALIAGELVSGDRGIVTGVKQSGVQAGTFFGGLLLPLIASAWDWRWAVASFLLLPAIGLAGTIGKGARGGEAPVPPVAKERLPSLIRLVAVYGVLSGMGTSAVLTFLPLFAAEDQAWSTVHAGWLVAGVGLIGVAARITWGRVAEARVGYGRALEMIAILTLASVAVLVLIAAGVIPSWALTLAALLLGVGAISWNSVGMLAVMERAPAHLIGRGTGLVQFGFLLGYAAGAPALGLSVDRLGSYLPGWIGVAVAFIAALVVARKISVLEPRPAPI